MPSTEGDYEFRLFLGNGTRAATSTPVTVQGAGGGVTLTVDSSTAVPGGQVTVTLTDGPGGSGEWLALAAAGAADGSYVTYVYVPAGATTTTWTATMPSTEGVYEFRLFLSNGTRAATSPPVNVQAPAGGPTLTIDTSTAGPGGQVTATLTNAPGGSGDWIALAAVGSSDSSYLAYVYVGAGATTATWTATMPSTEGDYEFRLILGNGTRAATSPPVTVQGAPTLTVDTSTATPGGQVTATLTNAPGGSGDWIALAASGAPDSSYLAYVYVGAGATTTTWTATMPSTEGDYEFRLFLGNGTRAATSPPVTVQAAAGGPTLTVDTSTAAPGSQVTATLTNAPGGASDWIALAAVGAGDSSYLAYVYVGAGATTATWTATMPSTEGDYEFRLFLGNGTRAATSLPVTVQGGPVLTVDTSAATPGGQVTATLTNAPGGSGDWIALAAVGASDGSYLAYAYVGAGATTTTWTATMPGTEGDYEFRLFLGNGTRAATSPPVTVQSAVAVQDGGVTGEIGAPFYSVSVLPNGNVRPRLRALRGEGTTVLADTSLWSISPESGTGYSPPELISLAGPRPPAATSVGVNTA
jgi:hypothetical protein